MNNSELFKTKQHNHSTTLAPFDMRNQFTWCPNCQEWYLPFLHCRHGNPQFDCPSCRSQDEKERAA